jgi:Tfp pilus assembly protein PilP
MKLSAYATALGSALLVMSCSDSGGNAAHRWLEATVTPGQAPATLPALPDIIDTPAVKYDSAEFADPFLARHAFAHVRAPSDGLADNPLARFPSSDLAALQLIGMLKKNDVTVALVSNGLRYENIRVGEFLGREQAEVTAISSEGVATRLSDGQMVLLKFNKRSP